MGTESRNPRSIGLDTMSASQIIRLMAEEEAVTVRAVQAAEGDLAKAAEQVAKAYQGGYRIFYVGAGTSGRVATMDAAEMPPTFGIDEGRFVAIAAGGDEAKVHAVEDAEDNELLAIEALERAGVARGDVVIGLAASGRTPFVVAACRHANQKGVWTCGIANNRGAPLHSVVDLPITLDTGPEVLTGSTRLKAGTAQKLALNAISTAAMVLSGKAVENLMVDVRAKNDKLKERCVRIVRELSTVSEAEATHLLKAHDWNVRRVLQILRAQEAVS